MSYSAYTLHPFLFPFTDLTFYIPLLLPLCKQTCLNVMKGKENKGFCIGRTSFWVQTRPENWDILRFILYFCKINTIVNFCKEIRGFKHSGNSQPSKQHERKKRNFVQQKKNKTLCDFKVNWNKVSKRHKKETIHLISFRRELCEASGGCYQLFSLTTYKPLKQWTRSENI